MITGINSANAALMPVLFWGLLKNGQWRYDHLDQSGQETKL